MYHLLIKEMFIILDVVSILATNLKFFDVSPFLNVFIANAMSFSLPKPLYMAEQRAQSGKRWEVDRGVCSV